METAAFLQRRDDKSDALKEEDEEDADDDEEGGEEIRERARIAHLEGGQQQRMLPMSGLRHGRCFRPALLGLLLLVFCIGCCLMGSRLRFTVAAASSGIGLARDEPSWAQLYELKLGKQVYHLAQAAAGVSRSPTPVRTIGGEAITLCVVQSNLIAIQLSRFAIGITNAVAMCAEDGLGGHKENATCSLQFLAMFITLTRMAALMSSIPLACDAYSYQTTAGCASATSVMLAEVVTFGTAADIVDSFCSSTPSWKLMPEAWPKPAPNQRPFGTLKLPPWFNKTKEDLALCILSVDQAAVFLAKPRSVIRRLWCSYETSSQ